MMFLEVDPSAVKPGWTPLIITILLAAAIALLMISMRRQIRRISVPHREEIDGAGSEGSANDTTSDEDPSATTEAEAKSRHGTAGERHPIGHG